MPNIGRTFSPPCRQTKAVDTQSNLAFTIAAHVWIDSDLNLATFGVVNRSTSISCVWHSNGELSSAFACLRQETN